MDHTKYWTLFWPNDIHFQDFREKNGDQIRPEIVNVLKSSCLTFVREVMGKIETLVKSEGSTKLSLRMAPVSNGFIINFKII
jgi:hypothetical protein